METFESFKRELYPQNDEAFAEIALRLFRFQAKHCAVYREYLQFREVNADSVTGIEQIPFLPIQLFKTHSIRTGNWKEEQVFHSSGTTGQSLSSHAIPSLAFYEKHSQKIFEDTFGPLKGFHVLCLLPSYLERTGSSLVAMAAHFIRESGSDSSGFFLNDLDGLSRTLESLHDGRKVLLLGVSFALLDLAERYDLNLSHCMVMETGGMKGRRKELIREELHQVLRENLHAKTIYSEYGMTELLSQAYSAGQGIFACPPSLRVHIREINDPDTPEIKGTGRINIIDLANFHSCAFIETQDLGRIAQSGHFEVIGRMDNSDIRGCNLLIA